MGLLLAFAPFIVFAIVDRLTNPLLGLSAAAVTSFILLARDALSVRRSAKILEIGTFLLFGGLALYAVVAHPDWPIIMVRLFVDAGLLVIVLISMAIGQPFTMQYAKEQVSPEYWESREFKSTNYVITGVWAAAFAVMVFAELVLLYVPAVPHGLGVAAIVLALVGAFKFTDQYPKRVKSRSAL